MHESQEDARKRARLLNTLDSIEAAASGVYLVLVVIVLVGAGAAVYWLIGHAPPDFGTQGEWFYVAVGALLVLGWGIGQTLWLLRRLRRASDRVAGDDRSLEIERAPGGFSLKWGSPTGSEGSTWTWNLDTGPRELKTIRIDEAQVVLAESAASAGKDWDEICRVINSGYDGMSAAEQALYRQAIQASVEAHRSKSRQ